MPRIISDLENSIMDEAEAFIRQNGITALDMRSLAAGLGVAVGTLYNYFSSKEELAVRVFKQSWEKTLSELERQADSGGGLSELVSILYDGIRDRKILFGELHDNFRGKKTGCDSECIRAFETSLVDRLETVFGRFGGAFNGPQNGRRVVITLLSAVRGVCRLESGNHSGNLFFLQRLAEGFAELEEYKFG